MSVMFRRRVFFLPGFDPFPPRRYREIYRREAARQARICNYELVLQPGASGTGWSVSGRFPPGETLSRIEVLVWADLVRGSMSRTVGGTYMQLLKTAWVYIGSGALWRLARLRAAPVIAALYPVAMLLGQLLLALALAALAGGLFAHFAGGWPGWLGAALVALPVAWLVLDWFRRHDHRVYAYYLMHDFAFTSQERGAYPPALEARLRDFTRQLGDALAQNDDEVLLVGHSSGAYLAASVMADLIRAGHPRPNGPALSLLTLGHVVPMASFLPEAGRLRRDLALLSEQRGVFWLDVSAPGDACCFGLCDPVAVTGVAGPAQRWPLVISAAFNQTLSPAMQRKLRWQWFRKHFQYLHAFDRPGDYDYFAITAGPQTLAARFAGRAASPGRIARPVGPGLA